MFKVCLLVFLISYAQLKWSSAQSRCGLSGDARELPWKDVEYFSFSSLGIALINRFPSLPPGIKILIKNNLI